MNNCTLSKSININIRNIILKPYCQRIGQLVAQNKNILNYEILPSLCEHKREMLEQKPLPKSLLTKATLVAHASKLIIKIWGSNPNWRLQSGSDYCLSFSIIYQYQ